MIITVRRMSSVRSKINAAFIIATAAVLSIAVRLRYCACCVYWLWVGGKRKNLRAVLRARLASSWKSNASRATEMVTSNGLCCCCYCCYMTRLQCSLLCGYCVSCYWHVHCAVGLLSVLPGYWRGGPILVHSRHFTSVRNPDHFTVI